MSAKPVSVIHGLVEAFEPSFKDGKFDPWNEAYGSFYPREQPVDGLHGAVLEIFEGEWFRVAARWGSEGPTNFLHYPDALRRAGTAGDYGGTACVYI